MIYVLALYLIFASGPQLYGYATVDGAMPVTFDNLAACEAVKKDQEKLVREALEAQPSPDVKGFELKCEKA